MLKAAFRFYVFRLVIALLPFLWTHPCREKSEAAGMTANIAGTSHTSYLVSQCLLELGWAAVRLALWTSLLQARISKCIVCTRHSIFAVGPDHWMHWIHHSIRMLNIFKCSLPAMTQINSIHWMYIFNTSFTLYVWDRLPLIYFKICSCKPARKHE